MMLRPCPSPRRWVAPSGAPGGRVGPIADFSRGLGLGILKQGLPFHGLGFGGLGFGGLGFPFHGLGFRVFSVPFPIRVYFKCQTSQNSRYGPAGLD